jgi:hypothetical protein
MSKKQTSALSAVVNPQWFTTVHSQRDINTAVDKAIEAVVEGEIDPLKVWVAIHQLQKACEAIEAKIKSSAVKSASAYGKGEHTKYMHVFSVRDAGCRYDYSICQKWREINEQKKNLETALKAGWIDEETGEFVKAQMKGGSETVYLSKLK